MPSSRLDFLFKPAATRQVFKELLHLASGSFSTAAMADAQELKAPEMRDLHDQESDGTQ
jgi:hypothetical protein